MRKLTKQEIEELENIPLYPTGESIPVDCGVSVRPSVAKFAEVMEKKLKLNDYKGGWEDCNNEYLLTRLEEEAKELRTLAERYGLGTIDEDNLSKGKRNKVINECADVANFAMMIAENIERAH